MTHTTPQGGTRLQHLTCAAVFLAFSFTCAYGLQDGLLALVWHTLPHGQSSWHALPGAAAVSLSLTILGFGISRLSPVLRRLPALCFVPSALLLGWLTGVEVEGAACSFARTPWLVLGLVLFVVLVLLLRHRLRALTAMHQWLLSLSAMLLLMLLVMTMGNTDSVLHTRLRAEQYLLRNDPAGTLRVLNREPRTDASLTMLRAYALAESGKLADQLFAHQLEGRSSALLPTDGSGPCFLLYPSDRFFQHLGARPRVGQGTIDYLRAQLRQHPESRYALDYLLCACLMEKRVDEFVALLEEHCAIGDSLPKHYREALLLYVHQHSAPRVVYSNDVLEADYQDYQRLYSPYDEPQECLTHLRETFGNTYWYYFDFF